MSNIYVRSTDGSDSDNGSTWALAKATLAGAAAIAVAGDTVWVSTSHTESVATATLAWAGTAASPIKVIATSSTAEPPTTINAWGTITVTSTTFSWTGTTYAYGIKFVFTSGSSYIPAFNSLSGHTEIFDNCLINYDGASSASNLQFGANSSSGLSKTTLLNSAIRLGNTNHYISIDRDVIIRGGSWNTSGASVTGAFQVGVEGRAANLLMEGFDLSALNASANLIQAIGEGGARAVLKDCKLPTSWSGTLAPATLSARVAMHNCDNADTHYKSKVIDYAGTLSDETTIVLTGGASDGTTPLSWKMVTTANVGYPASVFESIEIAQWCDTTGSKTATVEIVHDSQGAGSGSAFRDDEIWLEVLYLGTSGFPLAIPARNMRGLAASPANQTSSSATWTTTGLTTPVTQKLQVTFTIAEAGFILARVVMAKASKTVYVDPKLTVA